MMWGNRLRWCGHVLRKHENDSMKCMHYEVEVVRPRGRPETGCGKTLGPEDGVEHGKWRKLITDIG